MANPYFIKIELPTETKMNAVAENVDGSVGGNEQPEESPSANKAVKAVKKIVSYATVKSTANKLISNSISQVALETGATEYEERANALQSISNQVLGVGESVVLGLATGKLSLALAGIVLSGINTLINISNKTRQLEINESLENISIGMASVRAGVSGRRGRDQ